MADRRHTLIIRDTRDARAECSCGHWFYVSPVSDTQGDDETIRRIRGQFRLHAPRGLATSARS